MRDIINLTDANKTDQAYMKLTAEMKKWEEEAEKD